MPWPDGDITTMSGARFAGWLAAFSRALNERRQYVGQSSWPITVTDDLSTRSYPWVQESDFAGMKLRGPGIRQWYNDIRDGIEDMLSVTDYFKFFVRPTFSDPAWERITWEWLQNSSIAFADEFDPFNPRHWEYIKDTFDALIVIAMKSSEQGTTMYNVVLTGSAVGTGGYKVDGAAPQIEDAVTAMFEDNNPPGRDDAPGIRMDYYRYKGYAGYPSYTETRVINMQGSLRIDAEGMDPQPIEYSVSLQHRAVVYQGTDPYVTFNRSFTCNEQTFTLGHIDYDPAYGNFIPGDTFVIGGLLPNTEYAIEWQTQIPWTFNPVPTHVSVHKARRDYLACITDDWSDTTMQETYAYWQPAFEDR